MQFCYRMSIPVRNVEEYFWPEHTDSKRLYEALYTVLNRIQISVGHRDKLKLTSTIALIYFSTVSRSGVMCIPEAHSANTGVSLILLRELDWSCQGKTSHIEI